MQACTCAAACKSASASTHMARGQAFARARAHVRARGAPAAARLERVLPRRVVHEKHRRRVLEARAKDRAKRRSMQGMVAEAGTHCRAAGRDDTAVRMYVRAFERSNFRAGVRACVYAFAGTREHWRAYAGRACAYMRDRASASVSCCTWVRARTHVHASVSICKHELARARARARAD
eukprot:6204787-Pleurochrysis_carterae.AAC.1